MNPPIPPEPICVDHGIPIDSVTGDCLVCLKENERAKVVLRLGVILFVVWGIIILIVRGLS